VIRLAQRQDAEAMMAIYNEAVREEAHANCDVVQDDLEKFSAQYFFSDRYVALVGEDEPGHVVGWGALKRFSARLYDEKMAEVAVYITRHNRCGGLGKGLLKELIVHAERAAFHSLIAIIIGKNLQSIKGSASCGFTETLRMRAIANLYGNMEDIVWMQKVLT
jgi:phosphinothricin acetyltransferase